MGRRQVWMRGLGDDCVCGRAWQRRGASAATAVPENKEGGASESGHGKHRDGVPRSMGDGVPLSPVTFFNLSPHSPSSPTHTLPPPPLYISLFSAVLSPPLC
eukprot:360341-Chlamydomonas_euryale.AAC.18